jgi:hypothetical protein
MAPNEIAERYPPEWDYKTGRQVFYCPECGESLLGPHPNHRSLTWEIPLTCCAGLDRVNPWAIERPPRMQTAARRLRIRLHIYFNPWAGQYKYVWLPDV